MLNTSTLEEMRWLHNEALADRVSRAKTQVPEINAYMCVARRPGPPVPGLLKEGVTEGQVRHWANQVTPTINKALGGRVVWSVFSSSAGGKPFWALI